jgi:hypothetical protein
MFQPRDLSLGDLFTRLPLGQLWGLILAAAAICGVAFGLGSHVWGDDASRAHIQGLESTNRDLQQQLESANFKNGFFQVYLRYMIRATPGLGDPSLSPNEREHQLENAKSAFVAMVKQLFDEANSVTLGPRRVQYVAAKGENELVGVITFSDGTVWRIPPEIKREVHDQQ